MTTVEGRDDPEAAMSGSPDLAPVISELMQQARKAGAIGSSEGYNVARGLLVEAARVKQLLAAEIREREEEAVEIRPLMSEETWMATYGPKD